MKTTKPTKFQAVTVATEGAALKLILVHSTSLTVMRIERDVQRQPSSILVMATELAEHRDQKDSWGDRRAFTTSAEALEKDLPEPEV